MLTFERPRAEGLTPDALASPGGHATMWQCVPLVRVCTLHRPGFPEERAIWDGFWLRGIQP